jgi:hypothetical protein
VYDCGTNREISKTISQGIPFIKIQLHLYWLSEYEGKPLDIPAKTPEEQATKRKLIYFRRYLNTESIKLFGHSKATSHDGDKAYYRSLVH